jgi:hypothetical protein
MLSLEDSNKVRAAKQLLIDGMKHFMPTQQRNVLADALRRSERVGIAEIILRVAGVIETMPKTYETDGQGGEAVVHLHYFRGSIDAWITEKDRGDGGDMSQHQAFGKVSLGGGVDNAELGYVSISELIENNVELDLYWEPKTLGEL